MSSSSLLSNRIFNNLLVNTLQVNRLKILGSSNFGLNVDRLSNFGLNITTLYDLFIFLKFLSTDVLVRVIRESINLIKNRFIHNKSVASLETTEYSNKEILINTYNVILQSKIKLLEKNKNLCYFELSEDTILFVYNNFKFEDFTRMISFEKLDHEDIKVKRCAYNVIHKSTIVILTDNYAYFFRKPLDNVPNKNINFKNIELELFSSKKLLNNINFNYIEDTVDIHNINDKENDFEEELFDGKTNFTIIGNKSCYNKSAKSIFEFVAVGIAAVAVGALTDGIGDALLTSVESGLESSDVAVDSVEVGGQISSETTEITEGTANAEASSIADNAASDEIGDGMKAGEGNDEEPDAIDEDEDEGEENNDDDNEDDNDDDNDDDDEDDDDFGLYGEDKWKDKQIAPKVPNESETNDFTIQDATKSGPENADSNTINSTINNLKEYKGSVENIATKMKKIFTTLDKKITTKIESSYAKVLDEDNAKIATFITKNAVTQATLNVIAYTGISNTVNEIVKDNAKKIVGEENYNNYSDLLKNYSKDLEDINDLISIYPGNKKDVLKSFKTLVENNKEKYIKNVNSIYFKTQQNSLKVNPTDDENQTSYKIYAYGFNCVHKPEFTTLLNCLLTLYLNFNGIYIIYKTSIPSNNQNSNYLRVIDIHKYCFVAAIVLFNKSIVVDITKSTWLTDASDQIKKEFFLTDSDINKILPIYIKYIDANKQDPGKNKHVLSMPFTTHNMNLHVCHLSASPSINDQCCELNKDIKLNSTLSKACKVTGTIFL